MANHVRGRADLPEAAQVAELGALKWAARQGIAQAGVGLAAVNWPGKGGEGEEFVATASVGGTTLSLRLRSEIIPMTGHCDAMLRPPVPTPRWRLVSVVPAMG